MTKALIVALIVAACCTLPAMAEEKRGPAITSKVFFDVSIDGKEAGTDHWIDSFYTQTHPCDVICSSS